MSARELKRLQRENNELHGEVKRLRKMTGQDMPFDGKRMFWGGFTPIVSEGAR